MIRNGGQIRKDLDVLSSVKKKMNWSLTLNSVSLILPFPSVILNNTSLIPWHFKGGGTGQADQVAARPIIISKSQEQIKINDWKLKVVHAWLIYLTNVKLFPPSLLYLYCIHIHMFYFYIIYMFYFYIYLNIWLNLNYNIKIPFNSILLQYSTYSHLKLYLKYSLYLSKLSKYLCIMQIHTYSFIRIYIQLQWY